MTVSCSFFTYHYTKKKKSLNIVFEHILSCSFGAAVIAGRYVVLAFSKDAIYLYLNTGGECNEHLHRFTPKNQCPGSLVRFLFVIHWFDLPIICSACRESILPINWQQTLGKWQMIWMRVWRLSPVQTPASQIICSTDKTPSYERDASCLHVFTYTHTHIHIHTHTQRMRWEIED